MKTKNVKSAKGKAAATILAGEHVGRSLEVPGDKSISHRVAILSALSGGTSQITGYLQCEDCIHTLRGLEQLGASSFVDEDGELTISGTGGSFNPPTQALYLGNSGTGLRLLAGIAAGIPMQVELGGDASLNNRPMRRISDPLEQMGAGFEWLETDGCAPMRISGGNLNAIEYEMPVASAQVKSCILLASMFTDGVTRVTEPRATRDHTERLLRVLEVPVEVNGLTIECTGFGREFPELEPQDWFIPGDFSSGAFWMAAVAAKEGRRVTVQNVGLNPRRTALLDVLHRMGAEVTVDQISDPADVEPYGDVKVCGQILRGTEVSGDEIPNLIDELPLIAVLGALAEGETVIRDAAELRVKESDRISCVVKNLKKMNVDVSETEDGMIVRGGNGITPSSTLQSYGDHRIAMAMAILALYSKEPVTIKDIACTETSYPGFWYELHHQGAHVEFT